MWLAIPAGLRTLFSPGTAGAAAAAAAAARPLAKRSIASGGGLCLEGGRWSISSRRATSICARAAPADATRAGRSRRSADSFDSFSEEEEEETDPGPTRDRSRSATTDARTLAGVGGYDDPLALPETRPSSVAGSDPAREGSDPAPKPSNASKPHPRRWSGAGPV